MQPNWYNFQEDICDKFLSLGFQAETNKSIQGVRTSHDIDVYVSNTLIGQKLTWIIEAKYWKTKVSKNHILALRTIVDDIGADKGMVISKSGFQKGAIEAANQSNIKLYLCNDFLTDIKKYDNSIKFSLLEERLKNINIRYWSHSKKIRIIYGLRAEVAHQLNCNQDACCWDILQTASAVIAQGKESNFPIVVNIHNDIEHLSICRTTIENTAQLLNWLNYVLNRIDTRIIQAEFAMQRNGDFHPKLQKNYKFNETNPLYNKDLIDIFLH